MNIHRSVSSLVLVGLLAVVMAFVSLGCRPPFPQCRTDEDCEAEEGNTDKLVCVNGNCEECREDTNCPEDRPKCKELQCVECIEDGDCPEDKPLCEENKCVHECEVDADCIKRGKEGMICKEYKCQWECETDADCSEGLECKEHHCLPKCECQTNEDCGEGLVCDNCKCIEPACDIQAIYFDFDRYDLRSDGQSTLDQNAECLKQRAAVQITIEGHCDERGTEEYNISLGDKRARAAKRYLQNLGVDSSRIKTISYGEGRPACTGSGEDCWSQNRRAEFVER